MTAGDPTTKKPPGRRVLLASAIAAFFIGAVALAPASLLAPALSRNSDLQFVSLEGTVWRGALNGAQLGEIYLGDVDFRLSPLSLLAAAPSARISVVGGAATGAGRLQYRVFGGAVSLENIKGEFNLGAVNRYTLFGIPYQGRLRVDLERLRFSEDGCSEAAGDVWTDALDASSRQYLGDGLVLSGPARCEGGNLTIALQGANQEGVTDIELSITPDMTYKLIARVEPARPALGQDLQRLGFEANDDSLVYNARGALRGAGT